jgi:DNA polymerase-3 subunit delta'
VVIGHQKQLRFLNSARASGRLSHAYIFSGPEKTGKKRFALEWLSGILETKLGKGCAHPDFLFVSPTVDPKTNKTAGEITVDQIRGLISKLALTPAMGRYKAAIIDEAQLMNGEAQNCLLKTLEEPPGNALIILIVKNAQRLLETIRSRAEILQFNFVGAVQMEKFARDYILENKIKLEEPQLKEIVELSFGRPGRLADFLQDPAQLKKWQANAKEFARVIAAELPEKFAYAKKITDSENPEINLTEIIEIWQYHFRNLLLESLNSAEVLPLQIQNSQRQDLCNSQAGSGFVFSKAKQAVYSSQKISDILKKIHALIVVLQTTNASLRLAVENFLMDL